MRHCQIRVCSRKSPFNFCCFCCFFAIFIRFMFLLFCDSLYKQLLLYYVLLWFINGMRGIAVHCEVLKKILLLACSWQWILWGFSFIRFTCHKMPFLTCRASHKINFILQRGIRTTMNVSWCNTETPANCPWVLDVICIKLVYWTKKGKEEIILRF